MSAKHAVLGLVIEQPGYGYQLVQRLEERFGSSAFAPSGVYSALDQLSRDSLVRAAGGLASGPARRAAPRMIYEATEKGVECFDAWMLGSSRLPPLRDELHMKIALCRPRDVARLVEVLDSQVRACSARLGELECEAALETPARDGEWSRRMRALCRDAEIASWRGRMQWLSSARSLLERMVEDERPGHGRRRERAVRARLGAAEEPV
jgi:DNA-binding PadR family transcriptional regulator